MPIVILAFDNFFRAPAEANQSLIGKCDECLSSAKRRVAYPPSTAGIWNATWRSSGFDGTRSAIDSYFWPSQIAASHTKV
jgi:hypothetical protein